MKSPDQNRELFCESLGACSELVDESLRGLVRRILRPDTPGAVTKGYAARSTWERQISYSPESTFSRLDRHSAEAASSSRSSAASSRSSGLTPPFQAL